MNPNPIDPALVEKVKGWAAKAQAAEQPQKDLATQQLTTLQEVRDELGKLGSFLNEDNKNDEKVVETVQLMLKALNVLGDQSSFNADFAKPVVEALDKLQGSLAEAIKGIEVTTPAPVVNLPPAPEVKLGKIPAPIVNVEAPQVNLDLSGVQKILKTDIPRAFNQAIAQIPDALPTDMTPVLDAINQLQTTLAEINIGVRLKPLPASSMKVTNMDGSPIGGASSVLGSISLRDGSSGQLANVAPDGSQTVSNAGKTFRSGFKSSGPQPDPSDWTLANDTDGTASTGHLVTAGGNAAGSGYLRISLSPFVDGSEVSMISVPKFGIPIWARFGLSISQRILGQETFIGVIGTDSGGNVVFDTPPSDVAITGATLSVTTNVATITITNHPFHGGDRVDIFGCTEPRLNVGPVVVTPLTKDTFSVPITIANGTYTSDGFVRYADPFRYAHNGAGLLFENTTVTNASLVARRNGAQFRTTNETVSTTTAIQTNVAPFTDALNAAANNELLLTSAEMSYRSFVADGVATPAGLAKYTQGLPDESLDYKIYIRARNLKGMTMPVARITAIAKTGTTTATVTTDVPHGLTSSSQVQIYGVLDQVNYPNLTAQTLVASIIDANNFTVVIGTATTTSSSGGVVWLVQGSTLAPGVFTQVVQSVSCSSNVMSVIGNGTWATPLPGEYMQLWGMQGSAAQYDGAYLVLGVSTTTLWLAAPGVADFGSISTGGALIRRTDVRLHFVQVLDYSPLIIEGGRGNSTDINNSLPTSITNTPAVTLSSGTVTTVTSMTQMGGFILKDTLLNFAQEDSWANAVRRNFS